jgi:DNA-binding cell septation regulator SpoVG
MITVEQIKPISGAGNLRGFATVNIAGKVRISDCRIIHSPGKDPWVSMPSRAYDKDGQRKWAPIVEIVDKKLKDEISQAVLSEYAKMEPVKSETPEGW